MSLVTSGQHNLALFSIPAIKVLLQRSLFMGSQSPSLHFPNCTCYLSHPRIYPWAITQSQRGQFLTAGKRSLICLQALKLYILPILPVSVCSVFRTIKHSSDVYRPSKNFGVLMSPVLAFCAGENRDTSPSYNLIYFFHYD